MGQNSNSFNPARKQSVDAKLARYALAGGALLGLPAAAQAGTIVYTPGPVTGNPNQSVNINLDPLIDATTDFTLNAGGPGLGSSIWVTAPVTTFFTTGLTPLNPGDVITLANTTSSGNTLMKSHSDSTYTYPWGGVANGSSAHYLGVRFDIAGEQHLGWAEISMQKNVPSFTVLGYAYNSEAGAPIAAGDAPEPSSLALFAAGAAGIMALRRRRRAA